MHQTPAVSVLNHMSTQLILTSYSKIPRFQRTRNSPILSSLLVYKWALREMLVVLVYNAHFFGPGCRCYNLRLCAHVPSHTRAFFFIHLFYWGHKYFSVFQTGKCPFQFAVLANQHFGNPWCEMTLASGKVDQLPIQLFVVKEVLEPLDR